MPGPNFDFSDAFEALTAHPPFPWQRRLFHAWLSRGALPAAVEIPAGLGKTAVMAVWLLARATGAPLPRRLIHVVDRRAALDPATELAEGIRGRLERRPGLEPIRQGLRLGNRSLPISTSHGRFADDREWLLDPSAASIIVGTVETVGSRLLFEGHGLSRRVRPCAAGMIGCDSLVLLDDAELSQPFERLLRSIEAGRRASTGNGSAAEGAFAGPMVRGAVPPPLRVLPLRTPTHQGADSNACGLSAEDLEHGIVRARLEARKSLAVEDLESGSSLDAVLAKRAWGLMQGEYPAGGARARIAIHCDRLRDAEAVAARLRKLAAKERPESAVILLVGEERGREQRLVGDRLKAHGLIAGGDAVRKAPVFLVASSAGEVGIDLDADHMVCDLVAWDRMVRRLARVNRRGPGKARVLAIDQGLRGGPRARAESRRREATRALLEALPGDPDGGRRADPAAIAGLGADPDLRTLIDDATDPPPLYPALTRPVVDAWAMTSLAEHPGRPEIGPWLRGWLEFEQPRTTIVWRRYLPVRARHGIGGVRPQTHREVTAFFEAAPPRKAEYLETEAERAAEWIAKRAGRILRRLERETEYGNAAMDPDAPVAFLLDGACRSSGRSAGPTPTARC